MTNNEIKTTVEALGFTTMTGYGNYWSKDLSNGRYVTLVWDIDFVIQIFGGKHVLTYNFPTIQAMEYFCAKLK